MFNIVILLLLTVQPELEWQNEFISPIYERAHPDLGPLADFHRYGNEDFCTVQARPLYSGEIEGLPLYETFHGELADVVGYEFRTLYYTQKAYHIPGCNGSIRACTGPRNYSFAGYSVELTQEENAFYQIFMKVP